MHIFLFSLEREARGRCSRAPLVIIVSAREKSEAEKYRRGTERREVEREGVQAKWV